MHMATKFKRVLFIVACITCVIAYVALPFFSCDKMNVTLLTSSRRFKWCRAIQKSNCYHNEGHAAACEYGHTYYMLIFGIIQAILSQIPDFRNTEWLSVIAAAMSFMYSIIGSALGLAKVIGIICQQGK